MCGGDAAFLSNYFDHLLIFKNMLLSVGLFCSLKDSFIVLHGISTLFYCVFTF